MRVPAAASAMSTAVYAAALTMAQGKTAFTTRSIEFWIPEVEFWAANRNNRYRSLLPNIDQGPRQLTGRAGDEDWAHAALFLARHRG